MIPSHRRKDPKRLPVIGGLAVGVAVLSLMAVLAHNWTGGSLLTALSTEPAPGSVANPYCRSQPSGDLPPLDVSDMRLWNYGAAWHASQWDNGFSRIPWRSDHVTLAANGDVVLRLDSSGAPQIKSERRIAMADRGTWETEVTLPEMREGMVVAPLWLYNADLREEIDFEFAGRKSLDLSVHAYPEGEHRKTTISLFKGMDFSNCTVRFKIVADIPAGWASLYVEDELVHRFERKDLGYFFTGKTRPIIEMWAARDDHAGFVEWLGRWRDLPPGKALTMRVHGYRYSPATDER